MDRAIADYLEKTKQRVDARLKTYLPPQLDEESLKGIVGSIRYAHDVTAMNEVFAKPIWDFLDRGGKRWRPALFYLITEALGKDLLPVEDFALIPEFAHNGSIIIDDIEDRGKTRRGKPVLHKLFGEDVAINAGNLMYFLPLLVFQRHQQLSQETLIRAYQVYAEEMINIHFGQGMDIHWHRGGTQDISEEQYLQMVAFKTGCLARQAGRLAVVLAEGDQDLETKMGQVCDSIGIAFQIADDILSVVGEEFQKGKGYGDDITEGKRSLLVIHALRQLPQEKATRLVEILDMHTTDQDLITEALTLIKESGAVEYARGVAQRVVQEAWDQVDPLLEDSPAKQLLHRFLQFAIERDR